MQHVNTTAWLQVARSKSKHKHSKVSKSVMLSEIINLTRNTYCMHFFQNNEANCFALNQQVLLTHSHADLAAKKTCIKSTTQKDSIALSHDSNTGNTHTHTWHAKWFSRTHSRISHRKTNSKLHRYFFCSRYRVDSTCTQNTKWLSV